MDLFVSMSQAEVFPLSIAEAQSCGLPVICLNTGGMPEMIKQNINGYVVGSTSDLVETLNRFIQPEVTLERMRDSARNYALTNYSLEVVTKKYIEIYNSLISD
jgi:glycosyltransferase involved in cell wall biosynthesis